MLHGDTFSMNISPEIWQINVLLLSLISCLGSSLQIVVQFDGSLRPPNDFGVPTSTLGRMAACACSISKITSEFDEPCLLLVGGKGLEATSTSTSGEVEYEGLLFALKSLRTYLGTQDISVVESITSIAISGDCKTVIDQMNGTSNSRKLDLYHLSALAEVDALLHERFQNAPGQKLQFEHIPRTDNTVCDRLSASIILNQQKEALDGVCCDLLKHEKLGFCSMNTADTLDKWFLHQKSLIPLSRRPSMYRYIAEVEIRKKDYIGLLEIGRRFEDDVKIIERNCLNIKQRASDDSNKINASMITTSKAEAISYQIVSLYALGRNREAAHLQAKCRFLLNQCSSIVLEIEEQLKETDDLPKHATISLLKDEMDDADRIHLRSRSDWPFPVQQWYNDMMQSRTTWEKHRELLFTRQVL
jgi:ribonuclease HI